MEPMKDWFQKICIGIAAVILGAFIFFQTANFAMFLVIALGVYAVINGFFVLYTGMQAPFAKPMKTAVILRGGISLGIGLFAIFLPMIFLKITWITMLYVIGIQLLISGILGIVNIFEMRKLEMPVTARMVEAVVSIALALLILIMPQQIGETLLKVIGVFVVVYGISMIIRGYKRRKDEEQRYYRTEYNNK